MSDKYTSLETKKKIKENKDISKEIKDKEDAKIVISEEAYAVLREISHLNNMIRSVSMFLRK